MSCTGHQPLARNLFVRNIFIAASMSLAVPSMVAAQSREAGCSVPSITIADLANPDCAARIKVPTPRAAPVAASSKTTPVVTSWEYVDSHDVKGQARTVRLVGPRFLPNEDSGMDLAARSQRHMDAINGAFIAAAAYLGLGPAHAQTTAQTAAQHEQDAAPHDQAALSPARRDTSS